MPVLYWIIIFGLAMSAIALVGTVTLLLPEATFKKIIMHLVSLAAGTLIGGAFFHLLPGAITKLGNIKLVYLWLVLGFISFMILEQFLHWHHCHRSTIRHNPVSYLILFADSIHNFIGGLAVGAAFVIDIKLGILTWIIAAAHEIPQELGDFGILIHSGWKKIIALLYNFISAITFLIGGIFAYILSEEVNMATLLAFGAGNFIYIGAADLIPLMRSNHLGNQLVQLSMFIIGLSIMFVLI